MRERYRTILIQWRYQAELSAMGHEIHSSGIVIHPDGTVTHYISGDLKPEVRAKIEAKMKAEDEEKAKRKRRYQELSKEAAEKRKLEMELAYKRQNMTELLAKQAVDTSRGTYTTMPEAMASAVAAYENKMMLGSKGLLPPLIPDCSAFCAPAILKNIQNPP
ncbi:MAG: nuclear speckle splicing regulatory protein 1 family protein [Hungatella sp.]|nr:nuclear speckle splicing regulatory protein 1 family protein [Hungatella sp.]